MADRPVLMTRVSVIFRNRRSLTRSANQDIPKQVFRANITLFFLTLGISNLISQSLGGLVTRSVLSYTLWLLPALLGGTWLGTWLADRVSEHLFRKITLILVISTGLSAIVSSTGLL